LVFKGLNPGLSEYEAWVLAILPRPTADITQRQTTSITDTSSSYIYKNVDITSSGYEDYYGAMLRDFRLPPRCEMRSSFLRDVTQRRVVISYRRLGLTCRSHLQV